MAHDFRTYKLSTKEIATAFNVTERTIDNWRKNGFPRNRDKSYNLPECIDWIVEEAEKKAKTPLLAGNKENGADNWLSEWRRLRAGIAELDLMERKGELIPREKVETEYAARALEFSRGLMLLSRKIGSQLAIKAGKPLKEVIKIVDKACREILESYSRPLEIKQNGKN